MLDGIVPEEVRAEVRRRLEAIEREEHVRVFFACESGSRAWGFASRDSDFDARFLYAHPPAWYLSIDLERRRDVIERPITDDIDLAGWDIRKALQLLYRSNPPLLEWLRSPIVYREETAVAERFRALIPTYYSPRSSLYHYLRMAQGNFRDYLKGEVVWRKKYFYVLRPLLAVRWVEAGLGPVPVEFDVLVERTVESAELRKAIAELVATKRAGDELDRGPRIEPISAFVEEEVARTEAAHAEDSPERPDIEGLNTFFRLALAELWPESSNRCF